jgi:hypothetical protein
MAWRFAYRSGITVIKRLMAALAAALLLSGLLAPATSVGADAATSCDAELSQLRGDVAAVPITDGKADKERTGLLKLVDDAAALVARRKAVDAVVKLANLQTKVADLVAAGRIWAESGSTLSAGIVTATSCLTEG